MEPLKPVSPDEQPFRRPGRDTIRTRRYHSAPKAFVGSICAPPLQRTGASAKLFADRTDAGKKLAALLEEFRGRPDAVVVAIPQGGVIVGVEVARELHLPLTIWVSRKLSPPQSRDLAIGSVAEDGDVTMDEGAIATLRVPPHHLVSELTRQRSHIAHLIEVYRPIVPKLPLENKTVILVDDGVSTGATARAALRGLLREGAARRILASPVAPHGAPAQIREEGAELVAVATPQDFHSISQYYVDFPKQGDDAVLKALSALAPAADPEQPQSSSASQWIESPWL